MRPSSRRRAVASTLTIVMVLASCGGGDTASPKSTTASAPATTTEAPTTTEPGAPPPVAPLTGLAATGDQVGRIARPALAVKIDNSPEALPQWGVNNTDIVYEIQVEGISRLMAIFNSQDAGQVGPTRSARMSDPPILAMFGRPLFGWSGANEGVTATVRKAKFINNVDAIASPKDYKRTSARRKPHNLLTSTMALYRHIQPGEGAPPQQFQYLAAGETNPGAAPLAGLNLKVGTTPSTWVWDATAGVYKRWEYHKAHGTDAGQVVTTNVVVLGTYYTTPRSPIAKTTGAGNAIVLVGGTAITGVWSRQQQTNPYTLTATDGTPIKLVPGRTWVELADHPWGPLAPQAAAGLLAGGQ